MEIYDEVISTLDTPVNNTLVASSSDVGTIVTGSLSYLNGSTFVIRDNDHVTAAFNIGKPDSLYIPCTRIYYNKFSVELSKELLSNKGSFLFDIIITRVDTDSTYAIITNSDSVSELVVK